MIGNTIFTLLILVEISFMVFSIIRKSNLLREKAYTRIGLFLLFIIFIVTPIIDWSIKWIMLGLFLGISAILGILVLVLKKHNTTSKKSKAIFSSLGRVVLICIVFLPVLILPQYDQINPTGEYSIDTRSYTLIDESREEYFTEEKDNRKITVQFWYPSKQSEQEVITQDKKFPLVIFSHGAFGYRMSNYSTFQELASNGYIVCSIDHTYHAFLTKQEDGEAILGNIEFMNEAMRAQNGEFSAEETYKLEQKWMSLRTDDMSYVLNYIREMTNTNNVDTVFKSIDLDHIGVLGHSLGGATAAQLGRNDEEVDAVVVIDGTMMGEIIGFEDGKELVTDIPYPKPIINIYNQSHYKEALDNQEEYANMIAYKNALDSYQVVIEGSGHMNFTDLPIVSPFLSKLLGTGKVDPRYCIETTNDVVLQFFERYLKSSNVKITKERILSPQA